MKKILSLFVPLAALMLTLAPQQAQATLDVAANFTKPFTIETTTTASGGKIEFRHVFDVSGSNMNTINLDYRIKIGSGDWGDWQTASASGTTSYKQFYDNSITLSASTTYAIQFRGINSTGFGKNASTDYYRIILGSGSTAWNVTMSGNIMSLIVGYDTSDETTAQATLAAADEIPSDNCFYALFNNYVQTGVGNQGEPGSSMLPPVINAENLIFPAKYLKNRCYGQLFYTSSTNNSGGTLISSYGGGLNEGPCFLAESFTDKSSAAVDYTFNAAFWQCSSMKSAHFSFTSCPTSNNFNSYTVYSTPDNKTLYAPAGFNPSSCTIGTWNGGHTTWSYAGGGGGGGGSSSDPVEVDVYQAATVDTTKILDDLPANAVDLGTGVAWATTDYDASTDSKFAAATRGANGLTGTIYGSNCSCDPRTQISQNVWYAYSNVTPPANWRMPTQAEYEDLTENNTSYVSVGTNNKRLQVNSRISNDNIQFSAVGYVLYGSGGYYYNCVWQDINIPYYWITQTAYFGMNSSTQEPEIGGCDASCMMPARFVYNPSNTYTLTVHVGERTYTYKCENGQSVTVTAHAGAGYEFKWWSDDHSNTTAEREFIVDDDIEVTAVFDYDSSLPKHTATFVNWNGTQLYQTSVPEGIVPVYDGATPTKTYWEFTGWTPAITAMGESDVTYTATFTFESAAANVDIYQGAAADTMKIVYDLSAKKGKDGKTYTPVDMGYGVAWADRNVGATSTTNVGTYFQWGSTKTTFTPGSNNSDCASMSSSAFALSDSQDAAYVNVGSCWKMPTSSQWTTFLNNTTLDADGGTFKNKTDNSKTIFLPASGYWISSSIDISSKRVYRSRNYTYSSYSAYGSICLHNNGGTYRVENRDRQTNKGYYFSQPYYAMPVRAIYVPSYTTCTLTIVSNGHNYRYICQQGQNITVTANATTEGYMFDKWTEDNNTSATRTFTVTGNVSYTATFKEAPVANHTVSITAPTHGTITVTYTEGTEKTLTEGSSDIAENTVLTITAEGVDGYHCTGLTVGGNSFTSGNTHTLTADVTIAATFAANTYTVAFDKNGGSGSMDSESFTYGTEKNIPANGFTAPTGKHFNGWNTLANGSGTAYAAGARGDQMTAAHESTVTLFAQWADNTFTIAFDGNGGSGSMGSESYTYDTEKNIPANGFTAPAGMHFTGWNTEDDGTGTAYAAGDRGDQITTENGVTVTLYAQWTANTYALTLDKGTDGTDDGSATATYNSNTLTGYTEATRDDGWTLQGYFTAASDGDMVINAEGELVANVDGYTDEDGKWIRTTGSMTLFAQWAEPLNTDLILVDDQQNDYYDALAATYYGDGTNPVSLTSITFQRTFKAKQWAAFSLPFDWYIEEESVLDGIVYRFTGATGNANDGVYVKFSGELDQNKLEAGKPYLINPTTDITSLTFTPNEENPTLQLSEYILDDDDNQVALYEDGGTESTVRFTATNRRYTLHGRYINEVENPNWKRYVFLNNNRLYYPNASGNTMRPFRGFFYVDGAGSGIAPRVHIVADGQVVTEIEMMETDQTADEQSTSEVRKYVENGVLIIERNGVKYNAQGGRL